MPRLRAEISATRLKQHRLTEAKYTLIVIDLDLAYARRAQSTGNAIEEVGSKPLPVLDLNETPLQALLRPTKAESKSHE